MIQSKRTNKNLGFMRFARSFLTLDSLTHSSSSNIQYSRYSSYSKYCTEVLSYLLANLGFMRVACVLLFDVGFYRSFFYFKHTVLLVPTGSTLIRLCSSPSTEVVSY